MMRCFLLIMSLIPVSISPGVAQNHTEDSLWRELGAARNKMKMYDEQKMEKIHLLQDRMTAAGNNYDSLFPLTLQLFHEYLPYKNDSAYRYALLLGSMARQLKRTGYIITARLEMGVVLIMGGNFKEANDTLQSLLPLRKHFSPSQLAEYFLYNRRLYFDWHDYARRKPFSQRYDKLGRIYLDSAIMYSPKESYDHISLQALSLWMNDKPAEAKVLFEKLVKDYPSTEHQKAMVYASLGHLCYGPDTSMAMSYFIQSAIYDIRSSTKETVSFRSLAHKLYADHRYAEAYDMITLSYDLTEFYGSNHRMVELSAIKAIIDQEKVLKVEQQKEKATFYSIMAAVFSFIVIVLLVFCIFLIRRIRKNKDVIIQVNDRLVMLNNNLRESNSIKEEYLGYYFNMTADYINKIDDLRKQIMKLLVNDKKKEALNLLGQYSPKDERSKLADDFDQVFLKLFPDFVRQFNKLFKAEDQFKPEKENGLTAELRIFALIRLGIDNNEKIASVLDFSINTVYAYKTRVKNKSIVSNEEFVKRIMEIKSVDESTVVKDHPENA